MSFDLRDESWIPATLLDGATTDLSLRECFARASDIRRLSCELPTQSFAIFRLLMAIQHDAVGFHDEATVSSAMAAGVDADRVLEYLDGLPDRFDLFHPDRPFYQVPTLRSAKDQVSGLEKLIIDVPNGSPFMTTRGGAALERISAAEAAQWLVHSQAFDPSGIRTGAVGDPEVKNGKGYPIGPAWAGQVGGIVLHGSSLAETLVFNLVPTPHNPSDRPVWALEEVPTEQRAMDARPAGPVAVLTWQSRRIRLIGDQEGVTGVVLCNGDKLTPQNRQGVEHMTAWRYSRPQTKKFGITVYMPLKHDPERSSWRGLPGIISDSPETIDGMDATLQAATVASLGSQEDDLEDVDLRISLEIVGMTYGSQEAVVDELVHDSLDLRVPLLGVKAVEVRTALDDCVRTAGECVSRLGTMAANIARAAGDHDGTDGARSVAMTEAWSALDAPVRGWLGELTATTDPMVMRTAFQEIVRRVLVREASDLGRRSSPSAIAGRKTSFGFMTTSKAEAIFLAGLRKELTLAYLETTDNKEKQE